MENTAIPAYCRLNNHYHRIADKEWNFSRKFIITAYILHCSFSAPPQTSPSQHWIQSWKNKILHLLYINDLKVYTNNEEELQQCMDLKRRFSDDIGILFGYDKCGVLTICEGQVSPTTMLEEIPRLDNDK
eukprot:6681109-Ditylum_brightwellii.AAC.1